MIDEGEHYAVAPVGSQVASRQPFFGHPWSRPRGHTAMCLDFLGLFIIGNNIIGKPMLGDVGSPFLLSKLTGGWNHFALYCP